MSEVVHNLTIAGMTRGEFSGRVTLDLEAMPGAISANISHGQDFGAITTTASRRRILWTY